VKTFGALSYHEPPPDGLGWSRPLWRLQATSDVMLRLKRILPRAESHRTPYITLDHTTEVARDLEWILERWPLKITDKDLARLRTAADEHRQREEAVLSILSGDRPHLELTEPARQARDYQLVAADLALTSGSLLLADDLGLGKSMSGLLVLRDPARLPALVVCPTHLPPQWVSELSKTLPWLKAHIIRSGQPYDPAKTREMKGEDPDVLIVNYHKIRGWADHLPGRVKTVIFDEAQELRRANSDKYNAAARIADAADLRMGLTATPVYNYAGEIYNIMAVLAPDALGSREEFAREWGHTYWHEKLRVREPRALGTYLRDQGLMLRRTRADVGRELPEVVRVPHSVSADEKVYERLMEGAVDLADIVLHGERKEAFLAAGELDWETRRATGVSKAPYVAEFIRMLLESQGKVVLFGWHRDVYDIWLDRLAEFNPALYTGSESPAQKEESKRRFLEPLNPDDPDDPDACRVFIMSLRSGAGLDGLQAVTNVAVFGELDWSPGMHDQCIGRLHRDGQDESVVAYFLNSEIGSDPVVMEVLGIKRMQSEPLRDPDAELVAEAQDTRGRVRKLAEEVVAQRKTVRAAA
jgi:SNF2 family DNA or RNA helicase